MSKLTMTFIVNLLLSFSLHAQFVEDFSDSDFSSNPSWTGDIAKFEIDASLQLHLNAPAVSGEAYLSTFSEAMANAEWRFFVEISENPSSSNFTSVYLISDQPNLSTALQGYFVKIGGSADEVSLYRKDGLTETEIIDGVDGRVDTKPVQLEIKVNRDLSGNWTLSSKTLAEPNFSVEGITFDNTYTIGSYFGVYCQYTSTRSSAFFFDNFNITGNPVPDLSPPVITSYSTPDENQVYLTLNEPIDYSEAVSTQNYSLGGSNPSTVVYHNDTIKLFFDNAMQNGATQYLTVSGLTDLNSNEMSDSTLTVIYFVPEAPKWQSIFINEFLADPTPAKHSLPDHSDAEFIELFNADDSPFDLKDWLINEKPLPSFILLPGEYVILCRDAYQNSFNTYGQVIIPDSWPGLTNGGATITLHTNDGLLIDSLNYTSGYVKDGVSTERIYINQPCSVPYNYGLAEHENGATPGAMNSIFSDEEDTSAPVLQTISPLAYDSLLISFNEKAISQQSWVESISINESVFAKEINYTSDSTVMLLIFDSALAGNRWHNLKITNITDCEGNHSEEYDTLFYLDLTPPFISKLIIRDTATLEVKFSEKLEKGEAEREANFRLHPWDISPRKSKLTQDSMSVILDFPKSLKTTQNYSLSASAILDVFENSIPENQSVSFDFHYKDEVDSLLVINAYQINLYLSVEPEVESLDNSQIVVDRSVGNPARILKDKENPRVLKLIFSQPLDENRSHNLTIDRLKDTSGELLSTPLQRFFYDTQGPEIINIEAKSSNELVLYLDEDFYLTEERTSLWINGNEVEAHAYLSDEASLIFQLNETLPEESNLEIGLGGVEDQHQNSSDPEQDFEYYFDLIPPKLDSAYFLTSDEIVLSFHEPILLQETDNKKYFSILSPDIILDDMRFLKLENHKIILKVSSIEEIQSIDFEIFNLSDLNDNMILEPILVSLSNTHPMMSQLLPHSVHYLKVQFSRKLSTPLITDFLLNGFRQADSLIIIEDDQILLHFKEPFKEGLLYTLRYREQKADFTYRNLLERLQQSGPATLSLEWKTPLNIADAENISNYLLNDKEHPIAAVYMAEEQLLQLIFANNFEQGVLQKLAFNGLKDIDNFRIPDSEHLFGETKEPDSYEIIISEIMADPTPSQGLPEFEYLEILNVSDRPLQLEGLRIGDQNQTIELAYHWLLPGEYLILCDDDAYPQLVDYGVVMAFSSFPNLNAEADHLQLSTSSGDIVHTVAYDKSWYNDAFKNEGGWSLEMVDINFPCQGAINWAASVVNQGGTPGVRNSISADNPDLQPPVPIQAVALDANNFRIDFNEKLSSELASQFSLNIDQMMVNEFELHANLKSVLARSSEPLQSGKTYQINVKYVTDCSGNINLEEQKIWLVLPEKHQLGDVVTSEVLFRPRTGGVEFVELYNNSKRYINLQNWVLGFAKESRNEKYILSDDILILPPSSYLALTSDQKKLIADYPKASKGKLHKMDAFPNLPADEGTILLFDDEEKIMQKLSYSTDWHHPLLQENRGVSLERISWDMDEDTQQAWQSAASSVGYATPGYQNSQWMQRHNTSGNLTATPQIFFPDQSGYEDYTRIILTSTTPGSLVNIKIFDARGRFVRTIVQNLSLAEQNEFVWDGTDEQHRRAKDGHYVIWVETYNLSGEVSVSKTKVVIGSRY